MEFFFDRIIGIFFDYSLENTQAYILLSLGIAITSIIFANKKDFAEDIKSLRPINILRIFIITIFLRIVLYLPTEITCVQYFVNLGIKFILMLLIITLVIRFKLETQDSVDDIFDKLHLTENANTSIKISDNITSDCKDN